jgi:hypothetical protein
VIALLTTITIKLPANNAILVLICSYVGALYGGSRTAILLNIPGTAANAASCADGYALAQRGEAGRAIGIATSGAFTGTLFGVLCLAAFTPSLAEVALAFGAFEFFWLALFGVALSGSIVGDDPIKGWLMGALGLFVAQIGQEGLYAYDRFTFGWDELAGGISLIPALVGAFGLAEVLTALADPVEKKFVQVKDSVLPRFREVFQYWRTVIRSGVIGVLTGPPARRRRGLGRLDVVRRGEGDEQGEAPLRQGLDRRPDGRRDRRHGVDPRPHHPVPRARHPGLGAVGGADGGDDHPRHPARADDDDLAPALRLRGGGDDVAGDGDDPHLRPLPGQAAARHPEDPAHGADADHLPALHRRRVRDGVAPVRRLRDARHRHRRVLPAPARLPDGAVRARPRPRAAARQEPAPRPGALRRQPGAVLHAADLARLRGGDDLRDPALRAGVQGRGAARHRRHRRVFRSALGRRGGEDAA